MPHTPALPTATDYANNPREVVAAWTRQNIQLIHDDTHGRWFAFTLATTLTDYQLQQQCLRRAQHVSTLCGLATPTPTRGQLTHRGACVFLLPSISYAGFPHHHGLLRVPRAYATDETRLTIREHGVPRRIVVPSSVKAFFGFPRYAHLDLHLLHTPYAALDDEDCLRALPLDEDPQTASDRALTYWASRTNGELRRFDDAEWCPWAVRAALPNADTTKRGAW